MIAWCELPIEIVWLFIGIISMAWGKIYLYDRLLRVTVDFFFQSFSNCSVGSQFCGFSWCFPAVEFIIYFGRYVLCCLWQVSEGTVIVYRTCICFREWNDIRLSLTDSFSGNYRLAAGIGCRLGHSQQILLSAYSFVQEFYLHLQC